MSDEQRSTAPRPSRFTLERAVRLSRALGCDLMVCGIDPVPIEGARVIATEGDTRTYRFEGRP